MSSGSSEAKRPSWQQALFKMQQQGQQLSPSQESLISNIKNIEYSVSTICRYGSLNALDINKQELLKACIALVEVAATSGSVEHWRGYTTAKKYQIFIPHVVMLLFPTMTAYVGQDGFSREPDKLFPIWLNLIIASGRGLEACNDVYMKPQQFEQNFRMMELLEEFLDFLKNNPAAVSECETILKQSAPDAHLSIDQMMNQIKLNILSFKCVICYSGSPFVFPKMHQWLEEVKENVQGLLNSETPIYHDCLALSALDLQFKLLSWCHRNFYDFSRYKISLESDPLLMERFWRDTDLYLEMLKKAAAQARAAEPADPYSLALVNEQMLMIMLNGAFRKVSYAEIKAVSSELASAVEACAAFVPPLWKLNIEGNLATVKEKVLPLLKRKLKTGKAASISPWDSPSFMKILGEDTVFDRIWQKHMKTCFTCNMRAADLLQCSGCRSAWFCDSECQRLGWKSHKVACKKAQRANAAV